MKWLNQLAGGNVASVPHTEDLMRLFEGYESIDEVVDVTSRSLERYLAFKGLQVRTRGELDVFFDKVEAFICEIMRGFDLDRVRGSVSYLLSVKGDDGQYVIHLAASKGALKKAKYIVFSRQTTALAIDCKLDFRVRCEACSLLVSAVVAALYSYARYSEEFEGHWSDVDVELRNRVRASLGPIIVDGF